MSQQDVHETAIQLVAPLQNYDQQTAEELDILLSATC